MPVSTLLRNHSKVTTTIPGPQLAVFAINVLPNVGVPEMVGFTLVRLADATFTVSADVLEAEAYPGSDPVTTT